ncbi:MAG: hypothetical protein LBP72_01125 [Dysgonamonadaceae bacterium]|jgi:hypothetical protein|nr:hypothetical protein [Dysgonamonadaceae bacterium]
MAIVYKNCTEDGVFPGYACDPCGETEGGRVRGAVYFHKSLKSALTNANLSLLTWWDTQIAAGKVKIIPSTRGTYDGGTKNTVTGFGDDQEKITGKTYVAVVNDPRHAGNLAFYQALENNYKDYIFGFRTEKELRVANDVMTGLEVKDPVEEDANSVVLWQANVTWIQKIPNTMVSVHILTDEVKELFSNCIDEEEAD